MGMPKKRSVRGEDPKDVYEVQKVISTVDSMRLHTFWNHPVIRISAYVKDRDQRVFWYSS